MKLSTQGFGWRFSKNATIIIVLVLVWLGVRWITSGQQPTAEASRNTFVNGCVSGGADNSTCGCAYDRLLVMYPDFAINGDRINRIIKTGYNQAETDAIVSACVSQ